MQRIRSKSVLRTFDILEFCKPRYRTLGDIANKFGITRRQAQRDVAALLKYGWLDRCQVDKYGSMGYRFQPQHRCPRCGRQFTTRAGFKRHSRAC